MWGGRGKKVRFHQLVVRYTYFSIICTNGGSDNKGNEVQKKSMVEFQSVLLALSSNGKQCTKIKFQIALDFNYYCIPVPLFLKINQLHFSFACFTHGSTQGLLLSLHSRIILGRFRGPYGVPGIEYRSATCMPSTLPAVLLLRPQGWFDLEEKTIIMKLFMDA